MSGRIRRSRGYRLIKAVTSFDILIENRILILCDPFRCPDRTQTMGLSPFVPLAVEGNLNVLASENNEPIKIWILSTIGSGTMVGWELHDTLFAWKKKGIPIYTIGESCHNMGMIILAAGTPGYRYINKGSELEIELPLPFEATRRVAKEDKELLERLRYNIIDALADYCKEPEKRKEELRKIMDEGPKRKIFTPEEALEWGFVDKIITSQEFEELFCRLSIPSIKKRKCKKGGDNANY